MTDRDTETVAAQRVAPAPLRWGILGTGRIAGDFATALRRVPDAELAAVGSRSAETAAVFADRHDIQHRHTGMDGLFADPQVDVVYLAGPASEHAASVIAAARAGKHILVEKPFAVTVPQARRMVEAAELAGVFLMEAMWSRFLPAYRRTRELLAAGRIGDVLGAEATMGMRMWPDRLEPTDRMLDPARGGGGLLDVGVYPIQLAHSVLGEPQDAAALAVMGPSGVDLDVSATLRFPGGKLAHLQTSMTTRLPNTAHIYGTLGWIELPAPQHCPDSVVLHLHPETWNQAPVVEHFAEPIGGDGLRYQVDEVHRCIRAGVPQSPTMTWDDSIAIIRTIEKIQQAARLTPAG